MIDVSNSSLDQAHLWVKSNDSFMRCSCRGNRTVGLEDSENLVTCTLVISNATHQSINPQLCLKLTSDDLNLRNTMAIP